MSDRPEAPYPAETRAKGWRFEVDMETVKQSDTWLRAKTGAMRGALLLLWSESWQQTPCGTLPDDDELLALLLDMEADEFVSKRAVLLRGWWRAADGRLYHPVITERVLAMLDKRMSDAGRAAARRARAAESAASHGEVTRDAQATPPGPTREFDTKHQAPSTSKDSSPPPAVKKARKRADAAPLPPCPDDVAPQVWTDWLACRAKNKAEATPTVIAAARAEAVKAGMSLEAFLQVWCLRGTRGLQADWLKPHERAGPTPGRAADNARIIAELTGGIMSHKPKESSRATGEIIDV